MQIKQNILINKKYIQYKTNTDTIMLQTICIITYLPETENGYIHIFIMLHKGRAMVVHVAKFLEQSHL